MGVRLSIDVFQQAVVGVSGYEGLAWCEFGNQQHMGSGRPMRDVLQGRGVARYVSIDLNGRDGALALDLQQPVIGETGQFDVVTNYGTLEHINEQYGAWKNMHELCVCGGRMFHALPRKGHHRLGHGRYLYTHKFVWGLVDTCGYTVLREDEGGASPTHRMIYVALLKVTPDPFVSREKFDRLAAQWVYDTGDTTRTGDYSRRQRKGR